MINFRTLISVSVLLAAISCVNEEYDLEKEINTDIQILENISMPVGDVAKITIDKILSENGELSSAVWKDDNGDMNINLYQDRLSSSFDVSNSFSLTNVEFEGIYIHLNTGPLAGMNTTSVPDQEISFSSLNAGKPFVASQPIEFECSLPSGILDVRSVDLNAIIRCHFMTGAYPAENQTRITVKKGLEIEFPECITIGKACNTVNYSIIDGHRIRFDSDVVLEKEKMLEILILLDEIVVPAGSVTDNGTRYILSYQDSIVMTGDFSFNTSDIDVVPEQLRFIFSSDIPVLPVLSADVKLDVDMSIPDQEMEINEIPDMFKGDNICADLYNPSISLTVTNSTPLPFTLETDIIGYDASGKSVTLSLDETDGLSSAPNSVSQYLVSRRETQAGPGTINIVKPVIGDLIRSIPEKMEVRNCKINIPSEYVTVEVGKKYEASVEYAVTSPLSFGENLSLVITQEIENLGLTLEAGINSAMIELNLINSIPVDFELSAICLDAFGNEDESTRLSIDKTIKAGSHLSPSVNPLKLEIRDSDGRLNVDALRMTLHAKAPAAEFIGVPLNANQGIEIKDIVLTLPEGIVISGSEK